jgi:hypothetical protein
MGRQKRIVPASRKPTRSLLDWPSAPGAGARGGTRRWSGSGAQTHPALAGTAWLVVGVALAALYVASWRYFPY